MTRPGWFVVVFAPAVAVAAAAWPLDARTPRVLGTAEASPEFKVIQPVNGTAVGQGGCSSVGCHGAPGADAFRNGTGPTSWSSSALLWMAADPHRKAYAVLDGNLAKRMMAALSASGEYAKTATEEARCLACHTNPTLATRTDAHSVSLRGEGVSCEACHGNASGWLQPHTGFTSENRAAGYAAGGMTKLYDLGERAVACAGCHVGAPAGNGLPLRDMNHDMIAAGHPRLNFDFATYQFMLPRHWHERDRTKPGSTTDPNFEARAWLVGRAAHAEAACRLTEDRATRSDPWPEFAESSCVACHHTVASTDAPYPITNARPLGSLPWQPIWPVTRPADFAELNPGAAAGSVSALMAAMQRPRPAKNAGDAAKAAADGLSGFRRQVAGLSGSDAFAAADRVIRHAATPTEGNWDRDLTEQVYHGAAALERARIARGEKADPAAFAAAYSLLKLERGKIEFNVTPDAAAAVRGLLKK